GVPPYLHGIVRHQGSPDPAMMVLGPYPGLIPAVATAHTRRRRPDGVDAERESGTGMDDKLELLQRVPLFASLDRDGLEEIGQLVDTSPGVRTAVLAAAGARLRAMDTESVI